MPEEIPQKSEGSENSASNETLLKQIRDDFRYHKEYWSENYSESEKDMDCAAAIPPTDFKDDRAGRPCIWPDETSQYIKQFNNNLRQNKRSIKIGPRSDDATDQDAEHRQAYIRGIEYASKAASIYTTACESCAECGFGYWRITLRITGPNGEQEPRLARIPNWSTVYPDPDATEADFSDQMRCFVIDSMRETTFARKYPKAQKRSFSADDKEIASGWFSGQNITVAEYWVREELGDEDKEKTYKVTQYITNGLEILEKNDWIGSWIPIIGVFGEEKYVKSGGESKRIFMSLIRRARASQQMLAYVASQEAEEFGMMPRAALMGWKGMFDDDVHKNIHKVPRGYVDFSVPIDWNPQWGAPQLPTRAQFTPNPQAYELSYERWRRSIQSAMGSAPLPTSAQRRNEKSGIALEKIQNEQATGSFHITDNFMRALGNTGRQANELITKLAKLDSLPKQILGKDQKDEDMKLRVMPQGGLPPQAQQPMQQGMQQPQQPGMPQGGMQPQYGQQPQQQQLGPQSEHLKEADYFFAHRGQFEVTVSDGPNYASQREEGSAFVDTLLQNLGNLPQPGTPPALILATAIRLKNLGAIGDELADLLDPPHSQDIPPQAKAQMAQMQGQMQQMQQLVQQLQAEKQGKVIENQGRMEIEKLKSDTELGMAKLKFEHDLAMAEINTKAQISSEREAFVDDLWKQFHGQAHDVSMQAHQQEHEQQIAQQQTQAAQQQQATQIQAEQQQAQQEPQQ